MTFNRIIQHTWDHVSGTRVLMLKGRKKDDILLTRTLLRVTHDIGQWAKAMNELTKLALPGERIYTTVAPRCMSKAIRRFKEMELNSQYDQHPEAFYKDIDNRWASALMQPNAQEKKYWMFDIDREDDRNKVVYWLDKMEEISEWDVSPYEYETKNGRHIICEPFNRTMLPAGIRSLIHENPLMLLAY